MIRWLRIAAIGTLLVSMIGLGVGVGLFLVANNAWVAVRVPPWLTDIFGQPRKDLWLPALIGGWLVSIVTVVLLVLGSMFYVWRRRQYEALIKRLEHELAGLRNLPFTSPAPLEDLPELPDPEAARVLERVAGAADAGALDG